MAKASRLPMAQRLALLASFNAAVFVAYVGVIQRSKRRGGSLSQDGYHFWDMFGQPKHIREQEAKEGHK